MAIRWIPAACLSLAVYHNRRRHVCALSASDNANASRKQGLFAWGDNSGAGCIPLAPSHPLRIPIHAPPFQSICALSFSDKHAVAIDGEGDVWQWGIATGKQKPVRTLKGFNAKQCGASTHHVTVLTEDNRVVVLPAFNVVEAGSRSSSARMPGQQSSNQSWGWPFGGRRKLADRPLPPGAQYADFDDPNQRIVKLAVGREHAVVLTGSGFIYSMPLSDMGNRFGQLGIGLTVETPRPELERVVASNGAHVNTAAASPVKPSASDKEIAQERAKQADRAWLGQGASPEQRSDVYAPVTAPIPSHPLQRVGFRKLTRVPWLRLGQPVDIACGWYHTLVRLDDGSAYGFGSNEALQLGIGPFVRSRLAVSEPVAIPLVRNCTGIACAANTSYWVCETEQDTCIYSAGYGLYGQLGNGQFTHVQGTPVLVHTVSGAHYFDDDKRQVRPRRVKYITAGNDHAAAVMETRTVVDGRVYGYDVYVWGSNRAYQLGTGRHANQAEPVSPNPNLILRAITVEADGNRTAKNDNGTDHGIGALVDNVGEKLQLKEGTRIYCGADATAIY